MNLNHKHTFYTTTPNDVWTLLRDPNQLIKLLPYAQSLVFTLPHKQALLHLQMRLGKETLHDLRVEIQIDEPQTEAEQSFNFIASTTNGADTLHGRGELKLEAQGQDTAANLHLHTTKATGLFAEINTTLLITLTRAYIRQLLTNLFKLHLGQDVPTIQAHPPTTANPEQSLIYAGLAVGAMAFLTSLGALWWWRRRG